MNNEQLLEAYQNALTRVTSNLDADYIKKQINKLKNNEKEKRFKYFTSYSTQAVQ